MRFGETDITFNPVSDTHRKVLPVFGAHPLSNIFNQAPVLLVEGEDDEHIWQQAVRSARGAMRVYPCGVDGKGEFASFEAEVEKILDAVYDSAIGFSLRDRDLSQGAIEDLKTIKRMRLNCRSAENLMLTEEVLDLVGISWETLQQRIESWLENNPQHPHHAAMQTFRDTGFDRENADLKIVRNDLVGLMGSNKPWEVLVGQSIAGLLDKPSNMSDCSLRIFLGSKICELLLGFNPEVSNTK